MTAEADRDVTLTEAAVIVGRSELTLRRWVAAGRLPGRRVGVRIVVRESDVRRLLAGTPVESAAK